MKFRFCSWMRATSSLLNQSGEQSRHVVLTVPLRQLVEERLDGVEQGNLLRVDIVDDVLLGRALLTDLVTLGTDDDAIQRLLCQRPEGRVLLHAVAVLILLDDGELELAVQFVAAKQVAVG